jgi:hypothetical protein
MSNGYTREILVSATPEAAYRALTAGFDKWWTTRCNPISRPGDQTTFRFGSTYWVMVAREVRPHSHVELECVEAHHVHEGLPSSILREWEGTRLRWQVGVQGASTRILFVHEGLLSSLDCYKVCEQGWERFFLKSLKSYLDTGEGMPFDSET